MAGVAVEAVEGSVKSSGAAKAEVNAEKDTTEVIEEDGENKKRKKDPQVAARLQKLQNEKDLLLTKDRWSERVKSLNKEVTESMAASEAHEQTKGCLNKKLFGLIEIVWCLVLVLLTWMFLSLVIVWVCLV